MRTTSTGNVVEEKQTAIRELLDAFCDKHLNKEYRKLCREMLDDLANRKDPMFLRGAASGWAAGIIHAIGSTNFLFDKSFKPYCKTDTILAVLGVSQATMFNKSKLLRKFYDMTPMMGTRFVTKHIRERNPLNTMGIHANGKIVSLQGMPDALRQMLSMASAFSGERGIKLYRKPIGREVRDNPHYAVGEELDAALDEYNATGDDKKYIIALNRCIDIDPFFVDTYHFLADYYEENDREEEAWEYVADSFNRTIEYITRDGERPDLLETSYIGNRHLIRSLMRYAYCCWERGDTASAIEEYRYLLHADPEDTGENRFDLLALALGWSAQKFNEFSDNSDDDIVRRWFAENSKKFPELFDRWKREVNYPKQLE